METMKLNLVDRKLVEGYSDAALNRKVVLFGSYYFLSGFAFLLLSVSGYRPFSNLFSKVFFFIALLVLFFSFSFFRKIVDSERKNPLIGSSRKLGLILLVPLLLVLSAIPLSFLFVKYAISDGDVSLKLNVFLFLPVVLVLMSVTYFFLYHSVMVSLNSAIRDYRVNHKKDAEVNDDLSSSKRTENGTLTEGEKVDRKRNLDVCYLSSLFASAFLSISGYRPFLNSYTIVLFVLSIVLLAIFLFSMVRLLALEKRVKVLSGKQLASFLLLSLMQIVVSFVLSQVLGYTILTGYVTDLFLLTIQVNLVLFVLSETVGLYLHFHVHSFSTQN